MLQGLLLRETFLQTRRVVQPRGPAASSQEEEQEAEPGTSALDLLVTFQLCSVVYCIFICNSPPVFKARHFPSLRFVL